MNFSIFHLEQPPTLIFLYRKLQYFLSPESVSSISQTTASHFAVPHTYQYKTAYTFLSFL